MRLTATGDGLLERLALGLNLAPEPAGHALFGQTAGRGVAVAQRLGLFIRLARGPADAEQLAHELDLQPTGTRLLCQTLVGLGLLSERAGTFALSRRSRRWLDPASERYIGTWLEHSATYWEWYGDLERVVRHGSSFDIHAHDGAEQEYWRVYITGQYELARLSARQVARAIRLPAEPSALLDVAGGHGWFAAELCRRHAGLHATVLELPGSARVGREIIARAGLSERVSHREGDMLTDELGGPYDGALAFDIVHHLSDEQTRTLFARVRAALRPGATFAVLDMFHSRRRPSASAASLGLFFHLTSGADLPDPAALSEQLVEAGFSAPRRRRIRRIPDQDLYQATAL